VRPRSTASQRNLHKPQSRRQQKS